MPKKNILVTGGAGFIGSNLVDELLKNPDNKITVVDDLSTGNEDTIRHNYSNPNFKFIKEDIRNYSQIKKICSDTDKIYHLAVQCIRMSIFDPDLVHDVNVTGTLNLLKASLENNVKKFIYISSSEVYGTAKTVPMSEEHPKEPTTIYGASKLAGENYTKAFTRTHGLNTVIIRPFNSYGPREHFEGAYGEVIPKFSVRVKNNKRPLIFGEGKQTRDFTYISDTVAGIILASDSEELNGDVVNIAYGHEVSVNEIAKYILENFDSKLQPKYCPPRPGEILRHYADVSKAKKILNFHSKVGIEEGIKLG
ncbi:MAG: GDP-mannose 4,6-dehydratase, partial [Candidatus Pacearchaeota archaeon]|nr:GDP-mannose 4,6-dehydratase [Candidatus Pacearchaeota archaeon]